MSRPRLRDSQQVEPALCPIDIRAWKVEKSRKDAPPPRVGVKRGEKGETQLAGGWLPLPPSH